MLWWWYRSSCRNKAACTVIGVEDFFAGITSSRLHVPKKQYSKVSHRRGETTVDSGCGWHGRARGGEVNKHNLMLGFVGLHLLQSLFAFVSTRKCFTALSPSKSGIHYQLLTGYGLSISDATLLMSTMYEHQAGQMEMMERRSGYRRRHSA